MDLPQDMEAEVNLPKDEEVEVDLPEDEEVEMGSPEDEEAEVDLPKDEEVETGSPEDEEAEVDLPEDKEAEVDLPKDEEAEVDLPEDEEVKAGFPEEEEARDEPLVDETSLEEVQVDAEMEKVATPAKWRRPGGGCMQGWPWWPCSAWPGRAGWSWALLPMTVPTAPTGSTLIPCWSRPPAPPMETTTRWSALSSERSCR